MELTRTEWKLSLLDIVDFMRVEMIKFLQDEGRYFGKVKSYMNNLKDALGKFIRDTTEEDIEKYGKALCLLRSQIYSDFKRLGQRRLSPADRVIVLSRKLLEIIGNDPETTEENFEYYRELKTLQKVFGRLYDNIYLRGKQDGLYKLTDMIESHMSSGDTGKYVCDVLDLYHVEHPTPKVKTLEGPETLLEDGGVKEISL